MIQESGEYFQTQNVNVHKKNMEDILEIFRYRILEIFRYRIQELFRYTIIKIFRYRILKFRCRKNS